MKEIRERELVLVGGGHTHVQVLRSWLSRPVAGVRLTAVLDRPEAVYSGMLPGFVAGDYRAEELAIDVAALARRAGARVLLAPATRIDPALRQIELDGSPPLSYDVASLDVGASVRDLELPGVREYALPTRPIRTVLECLDQRLAEAAGAPLRAAVVGAGAAGIELAFTLQARLRNAGRAVEMTLICAAADILPGSSERVVRRLRREARRRGLRVRCGVRAVAVEKDAVRIEGPAGGERLPCGLAIWATGAAALAFPSQSPLPLDAQGFVRVRPTLQVVGHDDLFAVGDCACLDDHPWVPKAGVYAVREGPILEANLRARLVAGSLRDYRPQRSFLSLLHLGDRRALAAKWGAAASGRWVWRWKDRIDRRFVRRFQLLGDPPC